MGWGGPVTYRQYLTWSIWLNWQWDRPTRNDYYVMELCCIVARLFAKDPSRIQPKDFKLDFQTETDRTEINKGSKGEERGRKEVSATVGPPGALTHEQMIEASKQVWIARMGVPVKVIDPDGTERMVEAPKPSPPPTDSLPSSRNPAPRRP